MKGCNHKTLPEAYRNGLTVTSKVPDGTPVLTEGIPTDAIGGGTIVKYSAPAAGGKTKLVIYGDVQFVDVKAHVASLVTYDLPAFRNIQKLGRSFAPSAAKSHPFYSSYDIGQDALLPAQVTRPHNWPSVPSHILEEGEGYHNYRASVRRPNNATQSLLPDGWNGKPAETPPTVAWSPEVNMDALLGNGPVVAANATLLEKVAEVLRRQLPPAEDLRPRQEWGADGHTLDPMRAMKGDWDTAYRRTARRPRVSSPVITLMVTPGGCQQCDQQVCPVTHRSQVLLWVAPAVAAALLLEEAGWRVRVQVGLITQPMGNVSFGQLQGAVITVKEAQDRVDLRVLAAACATQELQFGAYGLANSILHNDNHTHGGQVRVLADGEAQLGPLWRAATGGAIIGRLPEMTKMEVEVFLKAPSDKTIPKDLVDAALEMIAKATGGHLMAVRAAGRGGK